MIVDLTKNNIISILFDILKQSININKNVVFDNLFDNNSLNRIINLNKIDILQSIIILRTITITLYIDNNYIIEKIVLFDNLKFYIAKKNEVYLFRSF